MCKNPHSYLFTKNGSGRIRSPQLLQRKRSEEARGLF
ncbi:MAG: hypothetical protein E2O68_07035 [Deltaproteobacteria bacterium]|nr:MAG: hypothetical protein E2O68_07035 [Deltaproteobacteria bacterium]